MAKRILYIQPIYIYFIALRIVYILLNFISFIIITDFPTIYMVVFVLLGG